MKRFASLFTGSADDEIHETITLLFKEKHSLIVKKYLDSWRGSNFPVHHPAVCPGLKWNLNNIKTLLWQGNLYCQIKEEHRSIVLNDVEIKEGIFK